MKTKDYYKILEIPESATDSEIKSAYRKLARKFHPDVVGLNGTEHFKDINEAYSVLSDSRKRNEYNALRRLYSYSQAPETSVKEKDAPSNHKDKAIFNNFWNEFINAQQAKEKYTTVKPVNGSDITTDVTITLSESINGTTKKINILHTTPCKHCQGRKFINGNSCSVCEGRGYTSEHKKLTVKIPAGVKNGYKIRIAGEGNQGGNGGKNGNLYLLLKIENKSDFKYDGNNLTKIVPITPAEAVLGAEIEVPVINGTVIMKISPNTNSGQKYRLQGQGLCKNGVWGDLIVTVEIKIPSNITEEEKDLYRKLAKLNTTNIRKVF